MLLGGGTAGNPYLELFLFPGSTVSVLDSLRLDSNWLRVCLQSSGLHLEPFTLDHERDRDCSETSNTREQPPGKDNVAHFHPEREHRPQQGRPCRSPNSTHTRGNSVQRAEDTKAAGRVGE